MTTTTPLDRPDPYSLKPKSPRRGRAASPADSKPAGDHAAESRLETLRAGMRAMTHELPETARERLASLATDDALEARDPIAIDALAYLSSVVWTLKDPVAAIDMVDRALELGPERFAPNQKGGEISWRLGLLEKAESQFLAALRASDPGTADAKAAERCLREVRKREARGIRHATKGIPLDRLWRFIRPRKPLTEAARDTAQRTA